MISLRKIRDKLLYIFRYKNIKILKKELKDKNVSIFSMNCFAGHIYQDLNWQYTSPTAGLFFFADDFVKICNDINIIKKNILFIPKSKYKTANDKMPYRKFRYPIGQFEGTDIEIHFLHYHTEKEAKDKWEKRVARFNFNDYVIVGFYQNDCNSEIVYDFTQIPHKKKIFFVNNNGIYNSDDVLVIKEFFKKKDSPDPYKYANIYYKYFTNWIKKGK